MKGELKRLIINAVGFQIGWLGSVLSAAIQRPELGMLTVALVLAVHFWLQKERRAEALSILAVAIPGAAADTTLLLAGLLFFLGTEAEGFPIIFVPWVFAMWLNFAATLDHSLRWLKGRWLIAAILGAIGGPTTYFAGMKLGAVALHDEQWRSYAALAIEYGVLTPLGVFMAARIRTALAKPRTEGAST